LKVMMDFNNLGDGSRGRGAQGGAQVVRHGLPGPRMGPTRHTPLHTTPAHTQIPLPALPHNRKTGHQHMADHGGPGTRGRRHIPLAVCTKGVHALAAWMGFASHPRRECG
jgi:hypothetical protein